jgi:hypothetical protein
MTVRAQETVEGGGLAIRRRLATCPTWARRAVAIFRKDVRHLWAEALVFPALLALAAWLDPVNVDYKLQMVLPAACWYIIVRVIHQEPLPGDRQYWLTRPYTWRDLFAAKVLFLALFVSLPFALFHAVTWAAHGIPVVQHLRTLFWKATFFTALYAVPAAAVAALTRNMAHAILAGLMAGLGWLLGQMVMPNRITNDVGSYDWMQTSGLAMVLLFGAAAILLLQYSLRRTGVLRGLAAATVAVLLVAEISIPRAKALVLEAFSAREGTARISLDGAPARLLRDRLGHPRLEIPIHVEGPPLGLVTSVREIKGSVDGVAAPYAAMTGNRLNLTYAFGPQPDFSSGFVDIRGSAEIMLFRRAQSTVLATSGRTEISGFGVCSIRPDSDGRDNAVCLTPHPRLALFVESHVFDMNWIVPRGLVTDPLPAGGIFEPLRRYHSQLSAGNPRDFADARVVAAEPVAYLSLEFHFPGVSVREGDGRVGGR